MVALMLGIIILAAGRGTRMHSAIPKVMHKVAGKPMLHHVLDVTSTLKPAQTIVVASNDLLSYVGQQNADYIIQENPQGTGHAVQCALQHLKPHITDVIILCGDTPLITQKSLHTLQRSTADVCVLSMTLKGPDLLKPYGRLVLKDEIVTRIVEMKDATDNEKTLPYANAGIYKVSVKTLQKTLPLLTNNNNSTEYYLTDIIALAHEQNNSASYLKGETDEFFGVNSKVDLSCAEHIMQDRLRVHHMNSGATLIDPKTVFFSMDTKVESDVIIHPFVTFGDTVTLKSGSIIYQGCHLEHATVHKGAKVGPFAHLRGDVELYEKAEVGNFVEIKKSTINKGAKIKHLSYIGDATIGVKANVGAGVITCNYNGFTKSQTIIGDGAFVGSNSSLIAPVTIHNNSIVGAGSTITQDVAENDLVFTRSTQTIKPKGAIKFKAKYNK
ncbi:MAG TPA: bifunctional UDP-N-acetylglucosamine diphosphorylase/glucosamine-1-phosphate N-acetyltransferase GlmU [Holosporales bacterium]|nr:bifunctional UDP-N-acetylglucosamine diphosphorylase/glucosamine-1-phosphate N-acetyltransferase GlmU [Holosporales bacterium]